jgi:glucokinase
MLLAGDVGGTKTHLGVFSKEKGPREPLVEAVFQNADYPDFEAVLREFLIPVKQSIHKACFGVSGPVMDGQCRITNLPWIIREKQIQHVFQIASVRLINDLEATANAIPFLGPADLFILNQGQIVRRGNMAVIAPGTGLGEAFLTWDGQCYRAYASEGGHADFTPRSSLELELLLDLRERFGHVSWENICSGKGISRIYQFFKVKGYGEEPAWLSEKLNRGSDPTPVIVAAALDDERSCDLCKKTLDLFVSILGGEAGNLALKVLAAGGVYLAGGISPRILSFLGGGRFMEAFRQKGRMSELMSRIPVSVIVDPGSAMLGAAHYGFKVL